MNIEKCYWCEKIIDFDDCAYDNSLEKFICPECREKHPENTYDWDKEACKCCGGNGCMICDDNYLKSNN